MSDNKCNSGGCKQIRDNKSIYHPSWKSGSGKGDQPRKVTKKYEENYKDIFQILLNPSGKKNLKVNNQIKMKM